MNRTSSVIVVAFCLIVASFAGLVVADLLPPKIEGYVGAVGLCSLALGALVIVTALAVTVTRAALRDPWRFGFRSLLVGILTLILLVGMAMAWGVRSGVFYLVVLLQLITPVLFVRYRSRSGSALAAALQGAGVAFVSLLVLGMFYVLVIGIERDGRIFPDIGPGLRGLRHLPDLLTFCVLIGVWPIPVVLLAGAVGGILGWKLRNRTPKNRPS